MNRVLPHAVVYFTEDWRGPSGQAVHQALAKGEPHIYVQQGANQSGYSDEIAVIPSTCCLATIISSPGVYAKS